VGSGNYNLVVEVTAPDEDEVLRSYKTIRVGDAPVTIYTNNQVVATIDDGATANTLAIFVDPNAANPAEAFMGDVLWGDGTSGSYNVDGESILYTLKAGHSFGELIDYAFGLNIRNVFRSYGAQLVIGAAMVLQVAPKQGIVIKGKITYSDQAAATKRPVRHAYVEFRDAKGNFIPKSAVITDENGEYQVTVARGTDLVGARGSVQTLSAAADVVPRQIAVREKHGSPWYRMPLFLIPQGGINEAKRNIPDRGQNAEKAFWVFDAAVTAARFEIANFKNVPQDTVDVYFPATGAATIKNPFGANPARIPLVITPVTSFTIEGNIYLRGDDFDSWDTITHEYGHVVQQKHGFFPFTVPQLILGIKNHAIKQEIARVQGLPLPQLVIDRAVARSKKLMDANAAPLEHSAGRNMRFDQWDVTWFRQRQLAFSEGFANFYGQSVQANFAPTPAITDSNGSVSGDGKQHGNTIELGRPLQRNQQAVPPVIVPGVGIFQGVPVAAGDSNGEDEEMTVARVLWDITDSNNPLLAEKYDTKQKPMDLVQRGTRWTLELLKNRFITTLNEFTEVTFNEAIIQNRIDYREAQKYGSVFELNNVAPSPADFRVAGQSTTSWSLTQNALDQPTFVFDIPRSGNPAAGGTDLLDHYYILTFRNNDFGDLIGTEKIDMTQVVRNGSTISWTPNLPTWGNLYGNTPALRTINWLVAGMSNNTFLEQVVNPVASKMFYSGSLQFEIKA
jgi:hypothetical protein